MNTRRSFDDLWASLDRVEGWLTYDQGLALFDAASRTRPNGRIVEIGSFRGRSTIVLASSAPSGVEIIAIDPHAGNDRGPREISGFTEAADDDHRVFVENLRMAGLTGRVRHLRMFSDAALDEIDDGPVDVLYIDGAHRYGPARADIRDWAARVGDGGMLLVHDSFSSIGVTTAILRELCFGTRFRYLGRRRSLAIYRADLAGGRAGNAMRQAAQLPWFARNVALKVLLTLGFGWLLQRLGRPVPEWPY